MASPEHEERSVREYMELEAPDAEISHLEKVHTERVLGQKHDVWDVHTRACPQLRRMTEAARWMAARKLRRVLS